MNLTDILNEWETDHPLNKLDLQEESVRSTKLHAKYLRYLMQAKSARRKIVEDRNVIELTKTAYYMGRSSPDVYKKEPFDVLVTKTDLPMYLKADAQMREINKKLNAVNDMIEAIEFILNEISSRRWTIKNIIDIKKFEAGG